MSRSKRPSNKKENCSICDTLLYDDQDIFWWRNVVYCEKHYDEAVERDRNTDPMWRSLNIG